MRQTFGMNQIMKTMKNASTTRKAIGYLNASQIAASTTASSVNDAAQFENGSGDVLMSARPPALVKCVPAVIVPPRSPAATVIALSESPVAPAASSAPAGMRMNVCTESQKLSSPGILSARNSIESRNPAAPITHGCCSTCRPGGRSM